MEKEPQKPREPARPAPEPTLDLPLHRCPFCHESVGIDDGDWVGCAKCLARHHAACWDEAKACGACRHPQRLVPEALAPVGPSAAGRSSGVSVVLLLIAGVFLVVLGGSAAVWVQVRARRSAEVEARLVAERERLMRDRRAEERAAERARAERMEREQEKEAAGRARLDPSKLLAEAEAERERAAQARADLELERQRQKEQAAAEGRTLELVVAGAPPGDVTWAVTLQETPPGLEMRKTGQLHDGRGLAKGYARRGPAWLDLEWDASGAHYRRVWLVDLAGDRFELAFPQDMPARAGIRGEVAAGQTKVMAFGTTMSARADAAADGTFELPGLVPGMYSIVAYTGDLPPHSGYGGLQVEVSATGIDLTDPVGPAKAH